MISYSEYLMKHEITHEEFYAQFVTDSVLRTVKKHIGLQRINASSDLFMNDIPLKRWDALGLATDALQLAMAAGCDFSPSLAVCINKAAARKLRGLESGLYPVSPIINE